MASATRMAIAMACCTGILYGAFALVKLMVSGWDPSSFVLVSRALSIQEQLPAKVTVFDTGYDGLFFYRLALNPFTDAVTDNGLTFDVPSYRHQRILYPFVVWLMAFGSAEATLWLLPLANLVGICLIAFAWTVWLSDAGSDVAFGWILPLYPGIFMAFSRDLSEVFLALFLLFGMLFVQRRWWRAATLCLVLAILSRETAIVLVGVLALVHLYERFRRATVTSMPTYLVGVPIVVFMTWQLLLFYVWGRLPVAASQQSVGMLIPLGGLASSVERAVAFDTFVDQLLAVELLFELLFVGCVLGAFRASRAPVWMKLSWVCYGLMFVSLPSTVWGSDWSFFRTSMEFYVLGLMLIALSGVRLPLLAIGVYSASLTFFLALTRVTDWRAVPLRLALPATILAAVVLAAFALLNVASSWARARTASGLNRT